MAYVGQYDQLNYSYISGLYNKLNQVRDKFSYKEHVEINKEKYDKHTATDISRLVTQVDKLRENKYIKKATLTGSPDIPEQYTDYIIPYQFETINTILDEMLAVCAYDPCDCNCNCNCDCDSCNCNCNCNCNCRNCYDGASTCTLRP